MASLKVGRQIRLRSDVHQAFIACEGFADTACHLSYLKKDPKDPSKKVYKTNEQVFQIVSVAGSIPPSLYVDISKSQAAQRVDLDLQKMASVPRSAALDLENYELGLKAMTIDELKEKLTIMLGRDERIAAVCAAFEPGQFDPQIENFALFASTDVVDKSVYYAQLTPEQGYLPLYRKWAWYFEAKDAQQGYWAEPYLDSGGNNVPKISYSVPIRQPEEGHPDRKVIIGVLKMDIELDVATARDLVNRSLASVSDGDISMGLDAADFRRKGLVQSTLQSHVDSLAAKFGTMASGAIYDQKTAPDVFRDVLREILLIDNRNVAHATIAFDQITVGCGLIRGSREQHSSDLVNLRESADQSYRSENWYTSAFGSSTQNRTWSGAYKCSETKEKMISYSTPFKINGKNAGVIRLEVLEDGLLSSYDDVARSKERILCASCSLECSLCYYQHTTSISKRCVCLRCFGDRAVPTDTNRQDYVKVASRLYVEWLQRHRADNLPLVYGQNIQLLHIKSGLLLSVGLSADTVSSSGLREFYKLELQEIDAPDPYMEGSESTYFTLLPASGGKSVGETILEGDQIRLLSTRWQWEVYFSKKTLAAPPSSRRRGMSSIGAAMRGTKIDSIKGLSSNAAANWKVISYGVPDSDLVEVDYKDITESPLALLEAPSSRSTILRHGDLIRFRNTSNGHVFGASGKLCSYPTGENGLHYNYEAEYKYFFFGRFQYTVAPEDVLDQLSSVWKIECVDDDGNVTPGDGLVRWNTKMIFRHVISHRHLRKLPEEEDGLLSTDGSHRLATIEMDHVEDKMTVEYTFQFQPQDHTVDLDTPVSIHDRFFLRLCKGPDTTPGVHNVADEDKKGGIRIAPLGYQGPPRHLWTSMKDGLVALEPHVDEDSCLSALKISTSEQKSIYNTRQYLKVLDNFIRKLCVEYDEFMEERKGENGVTDEKRLANDFCFTIDRDLKLVQKTVNKLCRRILSACNNRDYSIKMAVNNPIHELGVDTGLCIPTMQALLLKENILSRIFFLIDHPLFEIIARFSSTTVNTGQDQDKDEKHSLLQGLTGGRVTKEEQNRIAAMQERSDAEAKVRENCLNVYRACANVVCLMAIDCPEACKEACKGNRLDILLNMSKASGSHRLGVQRCLSLLFENGRANNSKLVLRKDQMNRMMSLWTEMMGKKERLMRARERAIRDMQTKGGVWRKLQAQDASILRSCHNFLRVFKALCVCGKLPDPIMQKQIISVLVQCSRRYVAGDTEGSTIGSYSVLRGGDDATSIGGESILPDEFVPPPAADFVPTIVHLIHCLLLGSSWTGGHDIEQVLPEIETLLQLPGELGIGCEELVKRVFNPELSLAARSRYCDILTERYFEPKFPNLIVNFMPFCPQETATIHLSAPTHAQQTPHAPREPTPTHMDIKAQPLGALAVDSPSAAPPGPPTIPPSEDEGSSGAPNTSGDAADKYVVDGKEDNTDRPPAEDIIKPVENSSDPSPIVDPSFSQLPGMAPGQDVGQDTSASSASSASSVSASPVVSAQPVVNIPVDSNLNTESAGEKQEAKKILKTMDSSFRLNVATNVENKRISEETLDLIWASVCAYLSTHVLDWKYNSLTVAILKLTEKLVVYDTNVADIHLSDPSPDQIGRLRILNTYLFALLRTRQRRALSVKDAEWRDAQQHWEDVISLTMSIYNKLFDIRVAINMRSVLSLFHNDGSAPSVVQKTKVGADIESGQVEMTSLDRLPSLDRIKEAIVFRGDNSIFPEVLEFEHCLIKIIRDWENSSIVMAAFGLLQREYRHYFELLKSLKKAVPMTLKNQIPRVAMFYRNTNVIKRLLIQELHSGDINDHVITRKAPAISELLVEIISEFVEDAKVFCDPGSRFRTINRLARSFRDVILPGFYDDQVAYRSDYRNAQDVARCLKIHDMLFEILSLELPDNNVCRNMWELAYILLALWTDNNAANIKKIEKRYVDDLFDHSQRSAIPSVVLCMTIKNKVELCEMIPKPVMLGYLDTLARSSNIGNDRWTKTVAPMLFLKTVVRVKDRLILDKQTITAKAICENSNILGYLATMGDEKMFNEFMDLLNFSPSKITDEASHYKVLQKEYYMELLAVLTRCAPYKFVYVLERAVRQSEESTLLCQASLPSHHLISMISRAEDPALKIVLLRFFEQVFGATMPTLRKTQSVKLLVDLLDSIEKANKLLDNWDWRKVSAHDKYHVFYVISVILPFLTGYYHGSFDAENAEKDEMRVSNDIFDGCFHVARSLLANVLRSDDIKGHDIWEPETVHEERLDVIMRCPGFGLESGASVLLQMADPDGRGVMENDAAVTGRQGFKDIANLTTQLNQAIRGVARNERKEAVTTQSNTVAAWLSKVCSRMQVLSDDEDQEFYDKFSHHSDDNSILLKTVLLVGEFAKDEHLESQTHIGQNQWINDNSAKFCAGYLKVLQMLVDKTQDEKQRNDLLNRLVDMKLPRILINLSSRSDSQKVVKATIALHNCMLEGGFKPAQDSYMGHLRQIGATELFSCIARHLTSKLKIKSLPELMHTGEKAWANERYYSWPIVTKWLRFMQLLCEGHNLEWQTYLNRQTTGVVSSSFKVSINMVALTVDTLVHLVSNHGPCWSVIVYWDRFFSDEVINVVIGAVYQLVDTIIEVQQGPCRVNQVELTRPPGRFLECCNWLMEAIYTVEKSKDDDSSVHLKNQYGSWEVEGLMDRQDTLLELQLKLLTALDAMVEGNVDTLIVERLIAMINFNKIHSLLTIYLDRSEDPANEGMKDENGENLYEMVLITYFIFVQTLLARHEACNSKTPLSLSLAALLQSEVYKTCRERYAHKIGRVELCRDDNIELALFRIPERILRQSDTATFRKIQSDTIAEVNRESLPSKLDGFLRGSDELITELISFPRLKAHPIVTKYGLLVNVTFIIAIVLNVMSIITSDGEKYDNLSTAMTVLGVIECVLGFIRIVSYYASFVPLAYHNHKAARKQEFRETTGTTDDPPELEGFDKQWDIFMFVATFSMAPRTLYQLIYVAMTATGLIYPVAYSYHLLDIIGRSAVLTEMFGALDGYVNSLALTALLWVFLLYGFASMGYAWFDDMFENTCNNKWDCSLNVFGHGLWKGIEELYTPVAYDDARYYSRFFYDIAYFLVLVVVMLAIVSGIIIDAFGASRDNRHDVEEDQEKACFICGIEKAKFEGARGWNYHYKQEHNMWNYIYFLAYLQIKDKDEYNGRESYVAELYEQGDIAFFPMGKALMLPETCTGEIEEEE